MTVVDEVRALFEGGGGRQYGGERLTQLAHALQCAAAAAAFIGADAVRLRRWDDDAKVAGLATPDIAHFAGAIRICQRA